MPLRIVSTFIFLLASFPLLSQQPSAPAKPPSDLAGVTTFEQLDLDLAKRRLQECETNLQKWNKWWTDNKDTWDEYQNNLGGCIQVVQSKKTEERIQTAVGYFSFAAGIVVSLLLIWRIWLAVRRFFQKRPFTPERKQLVALIIASLWASGAVVITLNEPDLTRHPVNLLATVFVLSRRLRCTLCRMVKFKIRHSVPDYSSSHQFSFRHIPVPFSFQV